MGFYKHLRIIQRKIIRFAVGNEILQSDAKDWIYKSSSCKENWSCYTVEVNPRSTTREKG